MKLQVRKLAIVLGIAVVMIPALGVGQSFNVDLDAFGGPPEGGNGAPSASFGAAANQAGFWNRVYAARNDAVPLNDLLGQPTSVTMDPDGGTGSGLSYNQPLNTGDYALLLNDVGNPEPQVTYTFSGLVAGSYRVVTYGANPNLRVERNQVLVPGAQSPNPQVVTGPMPGNSFVLGITHSVHEITITGNSLVIDVRSLDFPTASVNGFQLVLVPEPFGASILILGLSWLVNKKKKSAAVRFAIPRIPCRMRV